MVVEHVRVAEQFLHRADVVATFEQVRGEGMAQRVRRYRLDDARRARRLLDGALHALLVDMVAAHRAGARVG